MMNLIARFLDLWTNSMPRLNQEDRISMLSDDLIHHILSFIDTKSAVQTCVLSRRWVHVWKSLPHLNLYFLKTGRTETFYQLLLNNRYADSPVLALHIWWKVKSYDTSSRAKRLTINAITHQIQDMTFNNGMEIDFCIEVPDYFFESKSLKRLSFNCPNSCGSALGFWVKPPLWNLPALTLLHLHRTGISLSSDISHSKSVDPFSKFVNLKDLSLRACKIDSFKDLEISCLRLEKLTLRKNIFYGKILVSAPNLVSLSYEGDRCFLPSVNNELPCLKMKQLEIRLNSFTRPDNHRIGSEFVSYLHQFRFTKVLTLGDRTALQLCSSLLFMKHQPSPFTSLECLKLNKSCVDSSVVQRVKDYFLESSPTATVIEF